MTSQCQVGLVHGKCWGHLNSKWCYEHVTWSGTQFLPQKPVLLVTLQLNVIDARMASPGQPVPQGAGGRLEAREGLGGGHANFPG